MLCKFSYDELYSMVNCMKLIRAVYGRDDFDDLISRIEDIMSYMDNTPITEIYDVV